MSLHLIMEYLLKVSSKGEKSDEEKNIISISDDGINIFSM